MLYVDGWQPRSYQSLIDNSIFIKLSSKDQIENYNRIVQKDTLAWWMKQSDLARDRNFTPNKTDLSVADGIRVLRNWITKFTKPDDHCWIRGTLDQVCLDSLFKAAGEELLLPFNSYRDVRTAIDFLYPDTSRNGYVDVDSQLCVGFSRDMVLKHSPEHDCAFDAAMMLYGVK